MANVFDKFAGTAHAVAESTKMLATNWGAHIIDLKAIADTDNGAIVSRGAKGTDGVYNAKAATAGEPLYLVLTVPIGYSNEGYKKAEKYFYNAQGEIMRCLTVCVDDEFIVSSELVATGIEEGDALVWDATTGKYIATPATAGTYIGDFEVVEEVEYFNAVAPTKSYRLLAKALTKTVTA